MPSPADYEIRVVGARPTPLRDLYHAVLRWSWFRTLSFLAACFLLLNALFAVAFYLVGGISGGRSLADEFFFSVQTLGTIGYGALYPQSTAANVLVVAESLSSLLFTAIATGLVFAKFSRSRARIVFAHRAVITPLNGVPSLMLRVGNERGNLIVDAQVRMAVSLTETTAEGTVMYMNRDLQPTRERLLTLSRSWTIVHAITADSPLAGLDAEGLRRREAELFVMVLGLDDATMQPVAAQVRYFPDDILFDHRYVDILSELPSGDMLLDLSKFHETEPIPRG